MGRGQRPAMGPAKRKAAEALARGMTAHSAGQLAAAAALYQTVLATEPRHADALRLYGLVCFQTGQIPKALESLAKAVGEAPTTAQYRTDLALVMIAAGRLDQAASMLTTALAFAPADAEAWFNRALLSEGGKRRDEAMALFRRTTWIRPEMAEAHGALGALLLARGDKPRAVGHLSRALALDAALADARMQLGSTLQELGRQEEALACYAAGCAAQPDTVEFHNNRGNVLLALDRSEEAALSYRAAIALKPDLGETFNNLANALVAGPMGEHAGRYYRRAVLLRPNLTEALSGLGRWLVGQEAHEEAIRRFRQALALDRERPEYLSNLGGALRTMGQLNESLQRFRSALALVPDSPEGHNNLAGTMLTLGDADMAIRHYRRTLMIAPAVQEVRRNLLVAASYTMAITPAMAFAEHRRFAQLYRPAAAPAPLPVRARDPEKRLRVGYLSSDFRHHPITRNVWTWLTERDRGRFEVCCFAEVRKPDHVTEQLKPLVDGWTSVIGLSDAEVAAEVRRAEVDILVILAGHFDRNRPLVALHRPAPITVSAHDSATSGLEEMDYLLADTIVCPRRGTERFTERVVRLPLIALQRPIDGAPSVEPPPLLRTGGITFGSFNNPAKITEATVDLWAAVLRAVPAARLLLKYRNVFGAAVTRQRLQALFVARGVAAERLVMVAATGNIDPVAHHLALYHHVDIALDTFPFNGSTTTFEALWMGLPVVTLMGETMMARWAGSMLSHVGRRGWATHTPEDYVRVASALAGDRDLLVRERQVLRGEVARSPLCDAPRAMRHLERTYRALWRRWCAAT